MRKLRFFGLLAAVLLLAFALLAACDNGSTGPGDGPGDGPGTGPDTEGPAYTVPKAPGFTPTDPGDGENGGGGSNGTPPPPDITFTVAAVPVSDSNETTAKITITFTGQVADLLDTEVEIKNITGEVEKASGKVPAGNANGKVWTISLDQAKTENGIVTVTVKRTGIDPTPQAVLVVEDGVTPTPAFTVTKTPADPGSGLIQYHLQDTTKITIEFAADAPDGFDPKDIKLNNLPSLVKGQTKVSFGEPVLITDKRKWDIPITVHQQGEINVFYGGSVATLVSDLTKLHITKKEPIGLTITATSSVDKGDRTPTSDTLTFEFDSDPAILWQTNKAGLTVAKTDVKVSNAVGDGAITDAVIQAGTWAKDANDPTKFTLKLVATDVPKLAGGTTYLYVDRVGITVSDIKGTSGTSVEGVLAKVPVIITREGIATYKLTTVDHLGTTVGLKLTFDREIDAAAITYGDFTLTLGTATSDGDVALVTGGTALKQDPDNKNVYTIDLAAQKLTKGGTAKFKLNPSGTNNAALKMEIESTEYPITLARVPVTYTISTPDGQKSLNNGGSGRIRMWIEFGDAMVKADKSGMLGALVAGDFEVSSASGGDDAGKVLPNTAGILSSPAPFWVSDRILEVVFGSITATGNPATAAVADDPDTTNIDESKPASTGAVDITVKIVSGTTTATTYFIELVKAPKKVKIQFDA